MTAPAKHQSSFCDETVVKQETVEDNADLSPDPAFEYVTVKQETTEWELPGDQDSTQDPLNICKEECSPSEDLPVCSTSNIEKQEDVEDEEKTLSADDGGKWEVPEDQDSTQDPLNDCKEECPPSEDLPRCSTSNIEKQEDVEVEEKTLTADDGGECSSSEDFVEPSTGKSGDEEDEDDVSEHVSKGLRNGVESTSNCSESESTVPIATEDDKSKDASSSLLTGVSLSARKGNSNEFTIKQEAFVKNISGTEALLHKCGNYKKMFGLLQDLKDHTHMNSSEALHFCCMCHKTFAKHSSLKRHFRVHTGVRPYNCHVCNKNFIESTQLKRHLRRHTGESPHVCNVCNKIFTHSSALKLHSLLHTGERPHCCGICRKTFTQSNQLKRHSWLHTGERPYICGICNKTFTQSCHLKRHAQIHGGERA